ncbi:Phosphonoacetaldehyde hydrolase [Aquicella siphonis]|uniref:Phosphonoacetaldehyde hydrolase n=1 Tax=Aquicella siphonis TaxID=254247 RepID=A0A5E4PH94_9COXI|nr:phosphonoacetaldehyde hydrolase [Aquicella siphonis]VVC75691.1 Phosphonoacetaldehyde hydrolase [Aquicella siphonis]
MKQIEAVIFDWAGTTVDYGCMAPIHAMKNAFSARNLDVGLDEIRKPMGMLKIDHITAIMDLKQVRDDFNLLYGRLPERHDIETIYQQFEKNIFSTLHQHTGLINGVLAVQDYLRAHHIKIGSTTGYTREMITIVANSAREQGYSPDAVVSADQVRHGRPYPYMLQQNLAVLEVKDVRNVIKVGDTLVDIQEGANAGCRSVGVIMGGSMLGLAEKEVKDMPAQELRNRVRHIKYEMLAAGADHVIETIDELPSLIESIHLKINDALAMRKVYAA